jgi:uncharacterized protein YbcI
MHEYTLKKTKTELEAEFSRAIQKFEREQMARSPNETRSHMIGDMILVRLKGILSPAELRMAESREGRSLVKELRSQMFETSRPILEEIVRQVLGCNLISLHTDLSTRTGERIIVFTLDATLS